MRASTRRSGSVGASRARLDVGFVSSGITLGVPERIQAFRERFPDIHTRLNEGQTSQIIVRLVRSEVDLGMVRDAEPRDDLTNVALATEGFVAVLPIDHANANQKRLGAEALRNEPNAPHSTISGTASHQGTESPKRGRTRE